MTAAPANVFVSTDPSLIDETFTYRYLHEHMYWAKSLDLDTFRRAVRHSAVVAAAYEPTGEGGKPKQVAFARVVSDRATFAYLTDVFVVREYRGNGIAERLVRAVVDHPDLQRLRRFLLVTEDAAGLYGRFGFEPLHDAAHWMQKFDGGR
ncbi:GNAT family N-acetyltransferase [Paenibacillus flagellatus]|uniref:GNAT family N-acetyltransferase n=1 Tax=Paenibacillus flagellatus TaxID=2211139 RepID=A0A2V5K3G9_9BACL|nr:GNAT family N-acetyltransferase [Paenibacillus flagellatus]PYI53799.1 GNAT family N-acetyltransferase [Paenibacillus flagellatus]